MPASPRPMAGTIIGPLMSTRPSLDEVADRLDAIPMLSGLERTTLLDLAAEARWTEVVAGEVVALEGDARPGLYYLEYGWLKVVKIAPSGREQTLRFLEPGDTFNEITAFTRQPNPATAITLEPAGIWLVPQKALLTLIERDPGFARHVLARMAERMLHLVSLIGDLSLRPVTGRLARLLLESSVDDRLVRPRWYTQAELAARLGTVPDVVQRALRQLDEDGLIAVSRGEIRLLDPAALAAIAE